MKRERILLNKDINNKNKDAIKIKTMNHDKNL